MSSWLGPGLSLLAGEAYFSDGPFKNPEPYARYDVFGKFTFNPTPNAKLSLWFSELVFVGDEGTTEASRPTRRWGVDVEARYAILPWLLADLDLRYAKPRFRVTGKALPLAPTLPMNGGLTAFFTDSFSGALRARYLDDAPPIRTAA